MRFEALPRQAITGGRGESPLANPARSGCQCVHRLLSTSAKTAGHLLSVQNGKVILSPGDTRGMKTVERFSR